MKSGKRIGYIILRQCPEDDCERFTDVQSLGIFKTPEEAIEWAHQAGWPPHIGQVEYYGEGLRRAHTTKRR
jgi:hypothetical protein